MILRRDLAFFLPAIIITTNDFRECHNELQSRGWMSTRHLGFASQSHTYYCWRQGGGNCN